MQCVCNNKMLQGECSLTDIHVLWLCQHRSFYSLGQGLWLPVSKSFVVPPVELSINPIASCKTDVLVTEDPGEVRSARLIIELQSFTTLTIILEGHNQYSKISVCVILKLALQSCFSLILNKAPLYCGVYEPK